MKRAVIARFKIMSRMDIAETRVPQDGRIKLKAGGSEIDFRVNTMPTLFGEKVVLRMLSKGNLQLDLMKLGFEAQQLEIFKKGIYCAQRHGAGDRSHGQRQDHDALLGALRAQQDHRQSLHRRGPGRVQPRRRSTRCQIHKDIGLTFASVLRALLRQDPDTVLVGEIRDYETAEVAIQAALTGHLVLSTLHTNDAPEHDHPSHEHGRRALSGRRFAQYDRRPAPAAHDLPEVPADRALQSQRKARRSRDFRRRMPPAD